MTVAGSWWVKALNPNGVRVRSYQPVWHTYLRLWGKKSDYDDDDYQDEEESGDEETDTTLIVTRPLDFSCFGSGVVHGLA